LLAILLLLIDVSIAVDPTLDASEEIVVWGDPFARWDETTWSLHMELDHIDELAVAVEEGEPLLVRSFWMDARIHSSSTP
jgi:hypothetical protein